MVAPVLNIALLWLQPAAWVLATLRALLGLVLALPFIALGMLSGGYKTPLLSMWSACSRVPLGHYAFSFILGLLAPYSASIASTITALVPGEAAGVMSDRPWLRNPFDSIHALALSNFGEIVSGCAVVAALEKLQQDGKKVRGIVSSLQTHFFKKARGPIRAFSAVRLEAGPGEHRVEAKAELRDKAGDKVAEFVAQWTVKIA